MHEWLNAVHNRRKIMREHYGPKVAHASHIGEGCYLSASMWVDHHLMVWVYGGLLVIWVVHTVVVGLED